MSDERENAPPPTTGKEIGQVVWTNLVVLLVLQWSVIGVLRLVDNDRVGAAIGSLLAVGVHALYLLCQVLIKLVEGRVALGLTYLATLGMALTIGFGTCFAVAA